ncbi:hypothetical protein QF032_007770 [Streptomyces achromogenes]|nr:hypothetical protein [Streptomyces achromogenes]
MPYAPLGRPCPGCRPGPARDARGYSSRRGSHPQAEAAGVGPAGSAQGPSPQDGADSAGATANARTHTTQKLTDTLIDRSHPPRSDAPNSTVREAWARADLEAPVTAPAAADPDATHLQHRLLRRPAGSWPSTLGTALAMAGRMVGFVLGLRTFSQQGLFVVGGALVDRYGVRPIVLAGCVLRAAGFAWLGCAEQTWTVIGAVLLIGFTAALFSPAVESEVARQAVIWEEEGHGSRTRACCCATAAFSPCAAPICSPATSSTSPCRRRCGARPAPRRPCPGCSPCPPCWVSAPNCPSRAGQLTGSACAAQ